MNRLFKILFVLSGIIVLPFAFPPNPLSLYPIFVLAWFLRERFNLTFRAWPFIIVTMLAALSLECLAWLSNYLEANPEPALFHPQLIPDLLIAFGFYSGWVLVWCFCLMRWRFTILEVFIIQGVYGIVFEQDGAILLSGLAAFPLGLLLWLYVFLAYGSTMALAVLPFRESLKQKNSSLWKYPALLFLVIILSHLFTYGVGLLWMALGLIPERGSIIERPFF